MPKISAMLIIGLAAIFPTASFAEEITLTTYYPAPYGIYRQMRAQRMAIGDGYYNAATYPWDAGGSLDPNEISQDADLVIEGNVGIGTLQPTANLEVAGIIKATGGLVIQLVGSDEDEADLEDIDGLIWLRTDVGP
ncbi:MAG: hypothetical protein JSV30_05715 [Candidatus Omnitrophota bacterium]|nr:MAG: hypothetical protein JSV30_05715 [Candidatus Omnitrophota bacterium]